jgi:hypothetical protein
MEQPRIAVEYAASPAAERFLLVVECLIVFILGIVLMNYFYAASAPPGGEIGVPEHDSYYHIAMASMLPEYGLLDKFPWLQFVYFRKQGDDFVSHHTGFHVLLMPFVLAAKALTGDYLPGGRWAMSFVLGMNLMLFNVLLRVRGVPWRWLWIALFLLMPEQFFSRHGFVRAIGASFMFMQLTLLALFTRHYVLAGLAIAGYVHVYLGAVLYGPVIVILYAISQVLGPRGDRCIPWKMALITLIGWVIGVISYPYSGEFPYYRALVEFLWMQVFETGLSPDIPVGQEWKPYTDPWFLVQMSLPILATWVTALTLRLRFGPNLSARDTTLVLVQFVFLLLTFKSRRFIEYWPALCLLSAAYLAAPPLAAFRDWFVTTPHRRDAAAFGIVGLICAIVVVLLRAPEVRDLDRIAGHWRIWLPLIVLCLLPVLTRIWLDGGRVTSSDPPIRSLAAIMIGALVVAAVLYAFVRFGFDPAKLPNPRMRLTGVGWGLLIAAYGVVPLTYAFLRRHASPVAERMTALRTAFAVLIAVALPMCVAAIGAPKFQSVAEQVHCYYDLPQIRSVMKFMRENSQSGDIVFTDDWDIFPVFFYHNRHNYYIVGLDPKFTHSRRPDLWDRYVKISRGQVPGTIRVKNAAGGGAMQTVPVGLIDIREQFRARWVIADRDHRPLRSALAAAPELAELVYPCHDLKQCDNAEYMVFRMRDIGEKPPTVAAVQPDAQGRLYLSHMSPISMLQGYGALQNDRSVDQNMLRIAGESHQRGLGTHTPSKLVYEIPAGATTFVAAAGIDDETQGEGSATVSVLLDGEKAYESPLLAPKSKPLAIRVSLKGAKQITLVADPTSDGNRFDHVDWADAHFLFEKGSAP